MSSRSYVKSAQAGQLPLITPMSEWKTPDVLPDLRDEKIVAWDSETKDDGLSANRGAGWVYDSGYICGVSCAADDRAFYIPVRHPDSQCHDHDAVGRWLADHMAAPGKKVFHKAIYDLGWFWKEWKISVPDTSTLDDTMLMLYMTDENRLEYSLDSGCVTHGIAGKDETLLREAAACYAGVQNSSDTKRNLWKLPARFVGPYAEQDAVATLRLREKLIEIILRENTENAYQLEVDLIPLILEMRKRGIRVNVDKAEQTSKLFRVKSTESLEILSRECGRKIGLTDVRSSGSLARLFDAAGVPYPKTAKGIPSFEDDWMNKVDHWLPRNVVNARKYENAASKFVDNFILGYAHRGRIHAEIHQTRDGDGGTATTRLAYSDPALQQIPSRDKVIGPLIRKLFEAERGEVWGAPDFSQQEYRQIVHFAACCRVAGWEKPVEIYNNNPKADFHNIVVELTGLIRRDAKDANFAKAYRAGVPKFASMINKTEAEARKIYDQYDDKMPFVSRLAEFCDSRAQQRGYLILLDGARAHFDRWEPRWLTPEAKSTQGRIIATGGTHVYPCSRDEALRRVADQSHPWYGARLRRSGTFKALNRLIQGSSARQTKLAMRACWREGILPLIQMHDELGVSCGTDAVGQRVAEIMRTVVKLRVPICVDLEYGPTWGQAKADGDYGATFEEAMNWR